MKVRTNVKGGGAKWNHNQTVQQPRRNAATKRNALQLAVTL